MIDNLQRPDLSRLDPEIIAYIENLEAELERLRRPIVRRARTDTTFTLEDEEENTAAALEPLEPNEPPTSISLISTTSSGLAKRTLRHLYARQRRGGMGIFDIDHPAGDPPALLALADENQGLLAFTNLGRAFRLPSSLIPVEPVRAKGELITGRFNLQEGESLAAILPEQAQGYVALLSKRGFVRMLRHHVFGEYMKAGASMFDPKAFGPLVSATWTAGDADLVIATRQGKAIRFSEKLVPPTGGPGIRLADNDEAVAVAGVDDDTRLFLLSAEGKGIVRLMESFMANKAPGAGGKNIMATSDLLAVFPLHENEDIFIISELSKIIRFSASEVPAKDGVVQGVICMSLRNDRCAAALPASLG